MQATAAANISIDKNAADRLKTAAVKTPYILLSCHIAGGLKNEGLSIVTIIRKFTISLILLSFCALIGPPATIAEVEKFSDVPVKGMVTMIDLGAKKCIPCKMMAPILVKMEKQFEGRAAIVFIDVWEHNEQARRFEIRAIPTQIFFNDDGKEIYRHVGFMDEKAIVKQLKKMGVE